jgi:hypothetical protein
MGGREGDLHQVKPGWSLWFVPGAERSTEGVASRAVWWSLVLERADLYEVMALI